MPISFRRHLLPARFRSPDGSEDVKRQLEVRFDPLLGTSSRIAQGVRLQTAEPEALIPFRTPDAGCPFCAPRLDEVTPQLLPSIFSGGRIQIGETVLFPNLVPYSQYAAVAVFSPRHWLSLRDFTADLLSDNLMAAVQYTRKVYRFDGNAEYCAYNINYLYPSGGSLPHPHAQIYLDPYPTTMLRFQLGAADSYWSHSGRSFWEDLAVEERERRERFVGQIGRTIWMTAFAPLGFNEVRAVVLDRETLLDLTDEDLHSLALGIARVLAWYDAAGYNSFNLVLFSGPLEGRTSFRLNLCMVTRTALVPYYRSDAMYLERLHWEAAVDRTPEELAEELRSRFA